jgi:TOMM system kinase/cyclase fusion protein
MFCDLVGSTALSEKFDPEDLRRIMQDYQKVSEKVIKKYGGHVAKYLGDGILVYFGYPQAHEDDARRAVGAGLEIIESLSELPGSYRDIEVKSQVRIGIHTGLVIAGEMGTHEKPEPMAVIGETPNIAARLQSLAEPDTVLISSSTYKLVEGYFECTDLGTQELKGISKPVTVYRADREAEISSPIEMAISKGLTPLVGRSHELGILLERWNRAKQGEGQVILLSGEAGIGKSRLLQMLKESVKDEPHTKIESRGSPFYQNSALNPVIENLQKLLKHEDEDGTGEQIAVLEGLLESRGLSLGETVPLIAPLLSLEIPGSYERPELTPQMRKQKTLTALASWLNKEAETQPVIRIIEDLHWVDPTTLEYLSLIIEQAPTVPILILLTYRPEFTPDWAARLHITQISLNRLTDGEVESMAHRMTGGKTLPSEVVNHITAKTDGVPLFVEELTKMIMESDILEESEQQYLLKDTLPEHAIPTTLQDSLMARLDRLNTVKEVVQMGAALGREFSFDLFSSLSHLDKASLTKELTKLVDAELLYQRGYPPDCTYIFKHTLIQDAAYQSILKSKRLDYHRIIAHTLVQKFAEDSSDTQPELLAHHYTHAGLGEEAIPYLMSAGQKAMGRSANKEAISHFMRGIVLLKTLPQTEDSKRLELDFQSRLGKAHIAATGWAAPEVGKALMRARALCEELAETGRLYSTLWMLCSYHLVRAEYEPTLELGNLILGLAEQSRDTEMSLAGHHAVGMPLYCMGKFVEAEENFDQTIALYDPGSHASHIAQYGTDLGIFCMCWSALCLWQLGYTDQAQQRSDEAMELARQFAHPLTMAIVYAYTAMFHQFKGDVASARETAERTIAISEEHGFTYYIAWGELIHGWARTLEGDGGEQIAYMSKGLSDIQSTGAGRSMSYYLALLAEVYGKAQNPEEALDLIDRALRFAGKKSERWWEAEIWRLKGEILHKHSGDVSEAEKCFLKALDVSSASHAKSLELRTAVSLSGLLIEKGDHIEAVKLLSKTAEWFKEGSDNTDLVSAKKLLSGLNP